VIERYRWYAIAIGAVAVATVITEVCQPLLGPSISLFFFPAIMVVAIYGGYGPAIFTTVMATASAAFFFVPPTGSLDIGADDAIRLTVFAGIGVTIAALSAGRRAALESERKSMLVIAEQSRELAIREDRARVSRDLHDGVLQGMTGIRLELHDIAEAAPLPGDLHARLLATERALAIEQRELRRLIEDLNPTQPSASRADTLDGALRRRVARLALEWKTPITIHVMPSELAVAPELEQAIGLMCQEATINALKHAHPTRVSIAVAAGDDDIRLTVVDDGRGFPFSGRIDHEALVARNVGPVTLRERATAMHGRVTVESSPRGSRVDITLPRGPQVRGATSLG
jgi:signal transduction histidine kinase